MMLLASLLLSMTLTGDDCNFYLTPESASAEEAAKAAQAFAARCKDYGYKGIQTTVVERDGRRLVQILCDGGLTLEMKSTLNAFARLSGTSVELRFPAVLSGVDKEQFQPGARPSEDKAPAGTRWFRFRTPDDPPVLLRDDLVSTRGEIQMKTQKEKTGLIRTFWEISPLQTREIREAETKGKLGAPYLVMDGVAIEPVQLNTLERNEEGRIVPATKFYFTPTSRVVQDALANPMPFVLESEDTAESRR
ncbi:MAG: hypothetical protein JO332_18675 [Planctomycetaceae bacterium]|nr:hypothetical protein [Planctomycetaceae bacterium]